MAFTSSFIIIEPLLKHLVYNAETERIEADTAITTTLNSFYLGEQHKMSSGGENIFFTNLTKDIDWYPMWGGVKIQNIIENQDHSGVILPSARLHGDFTNVDFYGPLGTGVVEYSTTIPNLAINISAYGIEFSPAEDLAIGERLSYQIRENETGENHLIYEQKIEITAENTILAGGMFIFWFTHPSEFLVGSNLSLTLRRDMGEKDQNTMALLTVYNNTTLPLLPYIKAKYRIFEDRNIVLKPKDIFLGTVDANTEHRDLATYLVDNTASIQTIHIRHYVNSQFVVRDVAKRFNVNSVIIRIYDEFEVEIHTATLDKKNTSTIFWKIGGYWYYSEEGQGGTTKIASPHISSTDFFDPTTVEKTGATQVLANVVLGEKWVTVGHATLPDGVIMQAI